MGLFSDISMKNSVFDEESNENKQKPCKNRAEGWCPEQAPFLLLQVCGHLFVDCGCNMVSSFKIKQAV